MFVTHTWYVAARSGELRDAPLGRTICGRRVAMYRDAGGMAHAMDALCPHRGADLASGKVVDDTLQCPFHGLRFNTAGRCVEVPSQKDQSLLSDRLGVHSYPMLEQQGFLWIWPARDAAPDRDPPRWDYFDPESGFRRYQCKTELYPASYVNTLDNALDAGHLAFIHTGSIPGASRVIGRSKLTMYEDRRGYSGEDDDSSFLTQEAVERRRARTDSSLWSRLLFRFSIPFLDLAPPTRAGFIYELCGMVCFDQDYANDKKDYVLALITPGDEHHTWFFAEQARNRALNPLGDWASRQIMDLLVAEDREALKLLLPEAQNAGGLLRPALVQSDRTSTPFRRIYGAALRREGKQPPWATGDNDSIDIGHGPAVFSDNYAGKQVAAVGSG